MQVYSTIKELHNCIALKNTKSIGFVPTMGALHQGHLSLIKKAQLENDLIVSSVFVNPKQFNNPDDLKLYPKNLSLDTVLLENAGCDILFAPAVEEMYPNSESNTITDVDFGNISKVMEAKHRPGHFDGVVMVVKRLFEIDYPAEKIAKCANMILATKQHERSEDNDTNILIDTDLAILGKSPYDYQKYTGRIRNGQTPNCQGIA